MAISTTASSDPNNPISVFNSYDTHFDGTRFADMAKNNPYLNYNYQRGLWDHVGNLLGFRTNEDKVREQMEQASRDYNAQLYQLESEDAYNTPAAQAERMRQAGQNPDMLGTQGVAAAGEFAQEQTTPELSDNDNSQVAEAFIQTGMQLMNSTFDMFSKFLNLDNLTLSRDTNYMDFLSSAFSNISPDAKEVFYDNESGWIKGLMPVDADFAKNNPLDTIYIDGDNTPYNKASFVKIASNKRQKNLANKYANGVLQGAYSLKSRYETLDSAQDSRNNYYRKGKLFGNAPLTSSEQFISDVVTEFSKHMNKLTKAQIRKDINEANYGADYFGSANGTIAGEAFNKENTEVGSQAEFRTALNSTLRGLIETWSERAKHGDALAGIGVLMAQVILAMGMPSFSRSSGPKGVTTSMSF